MRKIIVGAQISLDGVMQAPGGPQEDPTNGFTFGGWAMPYFDAIGGEEISRVFAEPCDLLLGRKTYEIFAGYWPYYDESDSAGWVAHLFNRITKYVVSHSGDVDTSWKGTVLLDGIAAVKRLREQDGPNLVTQGSTELVHALLANDLVDAISTFTVPVVLGSGKTMFARHGEVRSRAAFPGEGEASNHGAAPHSYTLTRSRVAPTGLIVAHYERAGDIKRGDASLDSPTTAELARRERMNREG
jgi:dihydrofolate reductase